jgi:hypothetical protein
MLSFEGCFMPPGVLEDASRHARPLVPCASWRKWDTRLFSLRTGCRTRGTTSADCTEGEWRERGLTYAGAAIGFWLIWR